MNADGSGQTRLTDNSAKDWHPSLSPDGSRIAFYSERDGNGEIYVMNADGSGQTRLTYKWGWDRSPSWSPDGSRIVFYSDRIPGYSGYYGWPQIWVMNADGSGQTRLTNTQTRDWWPSWSPDGGQIAYVCSGGPGDVYICTMNIDGSGGTTIGGWSSSEGSPSWSPDGSRIVFGSNADGNWEIYVTNADGSAEWTNLTNNDADDMGSSWSH